MYQEDNCVNCEQIFTSQNAARIIPTCGHNICTFCLKKAISEEAKLLKCAVCQSLTPFQSDQIQVFPKDITILKHIRQTSISMSSSSKKLSEDTQIFSSQMLPADIKMNISVSKCKRHGKSLDIICINDKKLLCPHCAIFGEHRDHKFKTIEEFCKEVDDKRKQLRTIENKKAQNDLMVGTEQYKWAIYQQLNQKKDQMIEEVKIKFSHLRELIQKSQIDTLHELSKVYGRIQFQIKRLTSNDGQTQKLYSAWKEKSLNYFMNIDKEAELLQKIELFYNPLHKNFNQGQLYIKQIQQKNKSIQQNISSLIKAVSIEHSQSIQSYISNYVRIIEEPTNLTVKNITISREKSPQQKQERKKPVKVQFVKSNIIPNDYDSAERKERSKSKENNFRSINIEPLAKTRHSSRNQKIDRKMLTPQKKITPIKSIKRPYNGTPQKYKDNLEFAERMLSEFKKNTDTLDLTNCELQDEQIVQIVQAAAQFKKIKGLKAVKNKLTIEGLKGILGFVTFATNLNLSHNCLNEDALEQIIKKRDKFSQLRIINLSHNKINERKAKSKIEQLKRYGIIVTL